jgi:quinol-cytochrome oxidoreductase complex cytochrome b subunit
VLLGAIAALLLAAILVDAPLLAPADISVPENPAKSPWYFLGVQELVSYSAFTGGILVPLVLLLAAATVPFVDREEDGTGRWFGGSRGFRVVVRSTLVSLVLTIGVMSIAIVGGWQWTRNAPAVLALIANPGAILAALYGIWSWGILRTTSSTKLGVFALASCCLTGGIIITIVGIWLRGPNWEFMW